MEYHVDYSKMSEDFIAIREDVAVTKERIINLDKRINGALDIVAKHIEEGSKYRLAIVGLSITLIVNIFCVAYWYGVMNKQVQVNTERLNELEETHPRK
jgi:hypothetical protein